MRYAVQLPIVFRPSPASVDDASYLLPLHARSDVGCASFVTSLESYSYRIGARLARRVFKIGTLVKWTERYTVGWMCA